MKEFGAQRGVGRKKVRKKRVPARLLALKSLLTVLLVATSLADAQQSGKVPRIGFVSGTGEPNNPGPLIGAFRQGLRDLGYVEGKNIFVEYRYFEGNRDRTPKLVTELVQAKLDVLVSTEQSWIRIAKQATTTIPIVMVINGDPVAVGLVASFARPGGNVTGLTRTNRELGGKRLQLLNEVIPSKSLV